MTDSIRREITFPQPPEEVWRALTNSAVLAEWMYPNDFEPRLGHRFTFRVPPNPQANFNGIVHCEVLACAPPGELVYSWVAAGGDVDTRVSYGLEPEGSVTASSSSSRASRAARRSRAPNMDGPSCTGSWPKP